MGNSTENFRAARDQLLRCAGDYDAALRDFHWPELGDRFNWACDWFDVMASGNLQPALIIREEDGTGSTTTFDQMRRDSNRLARWLAARGVRKGDPVIVMLNNQLELWRSMLAVMKLGAVIMPTTTAVGPEDLRDRIDRGAAKHVICNAIDTGKFATVPGSYTKISVGPAAGWADLAAAADADDAALPHPDTRPDDRLLLYFTSGTTSRPKLVVHTQVSYPVGHLSTMYWVGIRPGDIHLNISSPGWAKHAWSSFFAPWNGEATIFIYNYTRFDAVALIGQMRTHGVNTFCAPPTVYRMLINADMGARPTGLREMVGAGEPLNPEVISQVQHKWGLTIRDGYGQTETTAIIANTVGAPLKPGSMGRPLPGVPVVLVDPISGKQVHGAGAEGEICLDLNASGGRPLPLMAGYQGNPELAAAATAHGVYHTADVASMDADGYITYIGRTDDVFKSSDYKISPFELESVLIEHPAVAEAAIVPVPDPVRQTLPKAYIALAPGYAPDRQTAFEILQYAREHLAPYLRVRRLEFYELPKTISGKIRRVDLRTREQQFAAAGQSAPQEWRDDQFPELKASGDAGPRSPASP
ncbi:MAG TPA: AMP-binding protein [Rhodanobacter sp.]|nr:AMP-binding protein [Rhodanobacter sp.]